MSSAPEPPPSRLRGTFWYWVLPPVVFLGAIVVILLLTDQGGDAPFVYAAH